MTDAAEDADAVIRLGPDSALVLWSLLARLLDAEDGQRLKAVVDNDAELWALNDVLLALETTLAAPFRPSAGALVQQARVRLASERGDWPG